jgi:hypothetical protein
MKRINILLKILIIIGLMTGCGGSGGGRMSDNSADSSDGKSDNSMDSDSMGDSMGESNTNNSSPGISITLKANGKVRLSVCGRNGQDMAIVNWGDGSPIDSVALVPFESNNGLEHIYARESEYIIKITGENITLLWCGFLDITNLEINVPALTELDCHNNKLTGLDLSRCPELKQLSCQSNQLTSLDVSKNTGLIMLFCDKNQLTGLDVSNNSKLFNVNCENNQLPANALNLLFNTLHNNTDGSNVVISIGGNPGVGTCDRSIAANKGWKIN